MRFNIHSHDMSPDEFNVDDFDFWYELYYINDKPVYPSDDDKSKSVRIPLSAWNNDPEFPEDTIIQGFDLKYGDREAEMTDDPNY